MDVIKAITDNLGIIIAFISAVGVILGYTKKLLQPLQSFKDSFAKLEESNKAQEEAISSIECNIGDMSERLDMVSKHSKDLLSERIMEIYNAKKGTHELLIQEKEALDMYYEDYKSEGGNHHIDKYYKRMLMWDVKDETTSVIVPTEQIED